MSARVSLILTLSIALASCSAPDGTPVMTDGSLVGAIRELSAPGSTYKARQARDDAKCREYGFTPGTEAYGSCRLQLDQIRATQETAIRARRAEESGQLSLLCKDAIARGDQGGTFVHC